MTSISSHDHQLNNSSMASLLPGLCRAAPKLSRDFFLCHETFKLSSSIIPQVAKASGKSTPLLRNVRFQTTAANPRANPIASTVSPLSALSRTIAAPEKPSKAKFLPETSSRAVAYWLFGSAASVFGLVVFGGLTRLTESGYASHH